MRLKYMDKNEDIYEYMYSCDFIKVVYGINFAREFMLENNMKIDYFCDRRANNIRNIDGIPVVTKDELNDILNLKNKRALIIICVGPNKGVVASIYLEICLLDMNAYIFDYFENIKVFSDKSFIFRKEKLSLYEHILNDGFCDTRMTERSVELALAKKYIVECEDEIIEIGAVTPYYQVDVENKVNHVVDPTDLHCRVDIRKSLFECDLHGKNVLSISTVEHVGTGDYNFKENENAVSAINKIISESKTCLVTAPIGYNAVLDEWAKIHRKDENITILRRFCNNSWEEALETDFDEISYTQYWANGLVVIKK